MYKEDLQKPSICFENLVIGVQSSPGATICATHFAPKAASQRVIAISILLTSECPKMLKLKNNNVEPRQLYVN